MRSVFVLIFLFGVGQISLAQVDVLGGFSQDTVVIGDAVDMTLSVEISNEVQVLAVSAFFLDSIYSGLQTAKNNVDTTQPVIPAIADFDMLNNGGWEDIDGDGFIAGPELSWDTTRIGSQSILEKTFSIRMWDPGPNVMLYPGVVYSQAGTQDQATNQSQMQVFVAPPGGLPAAQDSLQLAPIKNIKEEQTNFSDYLIYFIIIGLALIFGLGYWLYTKYYRDRKFQVVEEVVPDVYVASHELALSKLSTLKSKGLWQSGDVKGYQSELTHIIREYLEGRYDIAALESTTDEIVKSLITEIKDSDDVVSLKRILQVADLVKFAKAKPDENIHESFMKEAEAFVERTADETKQVVLSKAQVNLVQKTESNLQRYEEKHSLLEEVRIVNEQDIIENNASPEQIEMNDSAPLVRRFFAHVIDVLLSIMTFYLFFILVLFLADSINSNSESLGLLFGVLTVLSSPFYYVIQEYKWKTTLGKRIFGLKIESQKGEVTLKSVILRVFVKYLSFGFFSLPFVYVFFNKLRRSLHDRVSNTRVVMIKDESNKNELLDDVF